MTVTVSGGEEETDGGFDSWGPSSGGSVGAYVIGSTLASKLARRVPQSAQKCDVPTTA